MARFLLPDALLVHAGRCLHEHALSVSGGKIVGVIPAGEVAQGNLERYSGELWVAGPILAHAHLEDYDFPAKDWQGKPFSTWAGGLTRWRGEQATIGTEESADRTLAELKNAGCGLVALPESHPLFMRELKGRFSSPGNPRKSWAVSALPWCLFRAARIAVAPESSPNWGRHPRCQGRI